ncbi:ArsR/SmtB family transcription factor [Ornithinimicrobium murale]|uniref:ArsR/SmtB family transcription factor n=1 Tax=Ornithinimicrobium murale TaxID=1050153 RepID=UPI000E0E0355|nr:metalloregulator ArsR/SmtB family transcription factor [Ornithinimicrobium murale]
MPASARATDLAPPAVCAAGCSPAEGLPAGQAEELANLLKALADPVRLRLYSRIAATAGETCVCDLGDFGVSQPTISHHLRKLREAGLIESERRGTWVYYSAVPAAIAPLAPLLQGDALSPQS